MMDVIIHVGIRGSQNEIVSQENTARKYGSGLVDVFATPAMIAFMEMTAMKSIADLLPDGYTTVGTEVNVKHLHATPIGKKLRCESIVKGVSGRKIVFEVSVWEDEMLVGHGLHTRYVVDTIKFMSKF
jgi:fluoroacetyl-CoA thioesterase